MKTRLNIITLGVRNLQKSRNFYEKTLGWSATKDSDDKIVFFNHGGIILGLYPLEDLAKDAELPVERSGFAGITLAINLDKREKVDQLHAQVIKNGAKELVAPRETFWGGYDSYFAVPDGNTWEIAWAPFWVFNEMRN